MTYLYHYTDYKRTLNIIKEQMIRASELKSSDAVFGSGVYLTSMGEKHTIDEIAYNNWDHSSPIEQTREKVKFFFKIHSSDLPGVRKVSDNTRDVWLYPHDLDLRPLLEKKALRIGHIKDQNEWSEFCHLFHFEAAITKSDEILAVNQQLIANLN